jgi:hypothetical protein
MFLGLAAGGVAWGIVELTYPFFEVPEEYHVPNLGAPPEKLAALQRATERTNGYNAMLYMSLLGGLLAGALAAGRRSIAAAVIAVPIALVAGCLAGWVGSLAHVRWLASTAATDLMPTIEVQATMLSMLGLGVGLAYGASGRSPAAIIAGAIGGLVAGGLAGMLYPVVMSFSFPSVDTAPLIPLESTSRLIWIALLTALVGVAVATATQPKKPAAGIPRATV